jgi:hypothetical protein
MHRLLGRPTPIKPATHKLVDYGCLSDQPFTNDQYGPQIDGAREFCEFCNLFFAVNCMGQVVRVERVQRTADTLQFL